jgi:uncharacterized phiE125 gp8 family phage protein
MNALNVVTLAQAKLFLRVDLDFTYDDTLIESLIKSSVQEVEQRTLQVLYQRTIVTKNAGNRLFLYQYPLLSVETVVSSDSEELTYTLEETDNYTLVLTDATGIKTITFVAGYGWDYEGGTEVPEAIQTALKEMITYLYENRDNPKAEYPAIVNILLAPYRRITLF